MKINKIFSIIAFLLIIVEPVRASVFDTEILLLLTGPISEAVQETVLLIRRGNNFITTDSLIIGCIAGASAGVMVSIAPAFGFTASGVSAPIGLAYMAGISALSCGMSVVSAVVGMKTSLFLNQLHVDPPKLIGDAVDQSPIDP